MRRAAAVFKERLGGMKRHGGSQWRAGLHVAGVSFTLWPVCRMGVEQMSPFSGC